MAFGVCVMKVLLHYEGAKADDLNLLGPFNKLYISMEIYTDCASCFQEKFVIKMMENKQFLQTFGHVCCRRCATSRRRLSFYSPPAPATTTTTQSFRFLTTMRHR